MKVHSKVDQSEDLDLACKDQRSREEEQEELRVTATAQVEGRVDQKPPSKLSLHGTSKGSLITALIANGHANCVARAMATVLCPKLSQQVEKCMDLQAIDGGSTDRLDMVEIHVLCFMNVLHEIRFEITNDLLLHAISKEGGYSTSMETTPHASAPPQEAEKVNVNKKDIELHVTGTKEPPSVEKSSLTCQTCNLVCNSEKALEDHCNGKKHAFKVRLLQSKDKRGPEGEEQQLAMAHAVKDRGNRNLCTEVLHIGDDAIKQPEKKRLKQEVLPVPEVGSQFYCNMCRVACTSAKNLEIHITGKKHTKAKEIAASSYGSGKEKGSEMQQVIVQGDLADGANSFVEMKGPSSASPHGLNIPTEEGALVEVRALASTGQGNLSDGICMRAERQGNLVEIEAMLQENLVNSSGDVIEIKGLSDTTKGSLAYGCHIHSGQQASEEDTVRSTNAPCVLPGKESRSSSKGLPFGTFITSLITQRGCDCVARAMEAAACGCSGDIGKQPFGCGEPQKVVSCMCPMDTHGIISRINTQSHGGMVKVHAICFMSLLHEIRIATVKDLLLGALSKEDLLHSCLDISEKGLNPNLSDGKKLPPSHLKGSWICGVCNVDCISLRGLANHSHGRKHAAKLKYLESKGNFS